MQIVNKYKTIIVLLDPEDFQSYVGAEVHQFIKDLPSSERKWKHFSWILNNKYRSQIQEILLSVVSFSKEEMLIAERELDTMFLQSITI